jgi:ribose/xylose/arabinose/galactoside ABC-type transport system permease subunit
METQPTLDYQTAPVRAAVPLWQRIPRLQELGLVIVILLMGTGLSICGYIKADPGQPNTFLNPSNLIDGIATPMSYYSIMAVGMTFVIISGGIDISVGSVMGMSAMAAARVLVALPLSTNLVLVILVSMVVALGVGLLCGLLNGVLIVGLRMHPFIVTLGTLSIFRCITIVTSTYQEIPFQQERFPTAFSDGFLRWHVFGQRPMPLIIMVLVMFIGWFYLSRTVGGREIYAVGGNEEAARFSGLRIDWIKLRVYAIAGLSAGLAGLVALGVYSGTSTETANGYELTVVAAAVVGGASLLGGRGTALGALLGTLIIAMIQSGIHTIGLNEEYKKGIVGTAIIVAVAIDSFSNYLNQRRLAGAKVIKG